MTTDTQRNEDHLTSLLVQILGRPPEFIGKCPQFKDQIRAQAPLKGKGGGKADIRIQLGPQGILILEAKHGQTPANQRAAVADCQKRLENHHCSIAIALCYADGYYHNVDAFKPTRLQYAVLDLDNKDNPAWAECRVAEFGAHIKLILRQLGNADLAASQLRGELDKALPQLAKDQKRELAQALDLPITPQPRREKFKKAEDYEKAVNRWQGNKYDTAAIRGCLVIASAMLFHARLDAYFNPGNKPAHDARAIQETPYDGPWPPAKLDHCKDAKDLVAAFAAAWDTILALDYKPVFQTAIAGLKAPTNNPNWQQALKIIAEAAHNLSNDLAGARQDVMGRIFHRVLDTAPYDGSFYTGTAGATLLATLAIRPEDRDWNDLAAIGQMRVTDPACGTGTLPIAAAARIRELAPNVDQDELSKILVEKVLHLYDINLTATHMAATTMGLMSPSTQFQNMNVHRTRLGPARIEQGQQVLPAQLGSLEWLETQPGLIAWPEYRISEHIDTKVAEGPRLQHSDLFIMNPPFARDSLRYDQFTEAEEQSIKEREQNLLRKTAAHRSGGSNGFIVLGAKNLKENGRIATVLPASVAQGASGLAIRQMLSKMHVEYVIILKDPQGLAFSENTAISELLLITRTKNHLLKTRLPSSKS